jgi:hypothetical protein
MRSGFRATSMPPQVVINGKQEIRSVSCGAARVGERALIDLEDIGPAHVGQLTDQAVADDAGANDYNVRFLG